MFAMAAASVMASALLITIDHTALRVVWLFAALEAAWASGTFYQARRMLLHIFEVLREAENDATDFPERRTLLARLDNALGAYPNLWPHIVPIIAAGVGATGFLAVALVD